jgi:hypothetical protein
LTDVAISVASTRVRADDDAERVELPVRLRKQRRRKAVLSIVWRKRQMEACGPGNSASSGNPAPVLGPKRR